MNSNKIKLLFKLVTGKLQERETQLVYSSISSVGVKATTVLSSLLTLPLILNSIGSERYGMLLAVTSMAGVISFADFGLGFGLQNKLPQFVKAGDLATKKAISSTFAFLLGSTLLIIGAFLLIYNKMDWVYALHLKSKQAIQEVDSTVLLFALCFTLSIPFSIVQKIQIGLQKGYQANLWVIAGNLTSILALYICTRFETTTPITVLSIYGINLAFLLFNFLFYFFINNPKLRPNLYLAEVSMVKLIVRDSFLFFVVQCGALLLFVSNNIYLVHFVGPEAVTKFNIGYKMMLLMLIPIESIGPYLTPIFNEAILHSDFQWVRKVVRTALLSSLLISLMTSVIILYYGNDLLHIWLGSGVTLEINNLIAIAAFILLFSNVGSITSYIMLSNTLIQHKVIFYTTGVCLSLIVKYIWINQFGIVGAFWSTSIPMLLVYILPCLYILRIKRFL